MGRQDLRTGKNRIATAVIFLSIVFFEFSVLIPMELRFRTRTLANFLAVGILVLLWLGPVRRRFHVCPKWYFWPMAFMALSYLFTAYQFSVLGYLTIGVALLILYPLLGFLVKDAELTGGETGYLKAVTQAFHLSFYVFLIASLCLAPKLNAEQYSSLLGNPNAVGTYTDSVLIAELYLLHGESKTKGRSFFLHLVCFGLAGAILFWSASRSGELAAAAAIGIYALYRFLTAEKKKQILLRFAAGALALLLALPVSYGLLNMLNPTVNRAVLTALEPMEGLHAILSDPKTFEVRSMDIVGKADENADMADALEYSFTRFGKGLFSIGSFTSGRLAIWAVFIENIRFYGHAREEMELHLFTRYYDSVNAHNSYIQAAFSAGLFAGIGLLVFILALCGASLKGLRDAARAGDEEQERKALLLAMVTFAFLMQSFVSYALIPATSTMSLLFWLVVSPTLWKARRK